MKYKIEKNTVQETLILPLYSRKLCTELYPNLYRDETAVRLLDQIDYDFSEAEKNSRGLMQRFGALEVAMPQRPEVDRLTDYYAKAMMTKPMQWFCRKSGKSKFTPKDIAAMKATAALKAADRNPYSWNMEFYEYPDGSGYEGRFTKCGICVLMKELGLYDLTPALCHLDYTMSEAGGVTNFVRQYTLASGGPYCDCGYLCTGTCH